MIAQPRDPKTIPIPETRIEYAEALRIAGVPYTVGEPMLDAAFPLDSEPKPKETPCLTS